MPAAPAPKLVPGTQVPEQELAWLEPWVRGLGKGWYETLVKRNRCPSGLTEDELQHEAWKAVRCHLDQWDPARGKLSTWAHVRARGALQNYVRDAYRGHIPREAWTTGRKAEDGSDEPPPALQPALSLDAPVGHELRRGELQAAVDPNYSLAEWEPILVKGLSQLNWQQRYVLIEHRINGRTQRAVASLLGISQMAVSRYAQQAIDIMRSACGEDIW